MNVLFEASFARDLKHVQDVKLRQRVAALIEQLEAANDLLGISGIKKLNDAPDAYRLRVGDHRVGFLLREGVIILVRFLDRKEIYRYFP